MMLMYRLFCELTMRSLRGLDISIRDFALPSQSLLPQMKG